MRQGNVIGGLWTALKTTVGKLPKGGLVQVWMPNQSLNGAGVELRTQGFPFGVVGMMADNLAILRFQSCKRHFSLDVMRPEALGAPGRVFVSGMPEVCLSHHELTQGPASAGQAPDGPIYAVLYVPLYDEVQGTRPIGVLQVVQQEQDTDFTATLDCIKTSLEEQGLYTAPLCYKPPSLPPSSSLAPSLPHISVFDDARCKPLEGGGAEPYPVPPMSVFSTGSSGNVNINTSPLSLDSALLRSHCEAEQPVAGAASSGPARTTSSDNLRRRAAAPLGLRLVRQNPSPPAEEGVLSSDAPGRSVNQSPAGHGIRSSSSGCISTPRTRKGKPLYKRNSEPTPRISPSSTPSHDRKRSRSRVDVDALKPLPMPAGRLVCLDGRRLELVVDDAPTPAAVAGAVPEDRTGTPAASENGKPNNNRSAGGAGSRLTVQDLQSQFQFGLRDAAANLGVCPTTLKRACRRHGFPSWPRRELEHRKSMSLVPASLAVLPTLPASPLACPPDVLISTSNAMLEMDRMF